MGVGGNWGQDEGTKGVQMGLTTFNQVDMEKFWESDFLQTEFFYLNIP